MRVSYFVICVIFTAFSFGQKSENSLSLLSVQGDFDKTKHITLEWSLGENFIETTLLKNSIITQGFQQSFKANHGIQSRAFIETTVTPNPTNAEIDVHFSYKKNSLYKLHFYSIQGVLVKQISLTTSNNQIRINLSDLPSGIYTLKISDKENSPYKIHKVIKY